VASTVHLNFDWVQQDVEVLGITQGTSQELKGVLRKLANAFGKELYSVKNYITSGKHAKARTGIMGMSLKPCGSICMVKGNRPQKCK